MVVNNQKGFTIIEMLITIGIFSVTVLMVSAVIIGIARSYQKSTFSARISETARSVQKELYIGIAYQGGVFQSTANGYNYICSGENIYFWKNQSGTAFTSGTGDPSGVGLYKIVDSHCQEAVNDATANPDGRSGVDNLLPNSSVIGFVDNFSITPQTAGDSSCQSGCNINLKIKIGTPDMFEGGNLDNQCLSTLKGGDYCSEVEYNSFVKSRIGY